METLIYIMIGIVIGIIIMCKYVNVYFSKNPYEIVWKGRTYVFTDKSDTVDNNITSSV